MSNKIVRTEKKSNGIEVINKPMSTGEVLQHVELVQQVLKKVMKDKVHYGVIPGCGDKPTLLKPGAELINLTFKMAPKYDITETILDNGHKEYEIICSLYTIRDEVFLGQGVGCCTTMESKYRFRDAQRTCPECGQTSIIKGKEEYGGGFLCWAKKGGCGKKFNENDSTIIDQKLGRIEYECPADYYNTCKKIGKKRALVDAVLTVTAASDIFAQDLDEISHLVVKEVLETKEGKSNSKPPSKKKLIPKIKPSPKSIKNSDAKMQAEKKESESSESDLKERIKLEKKNKLNKLLDDVYQTTGYDDIQDLKDELLDECDVKQVNLMNIDKLILKAEEWYKEYCEKGDKE